MLRETHKLHSKRWKDQRTNVHTDRGVNRHPDALFTRKDSWQTLWWHKANARLPNAPNKQTPSFSLQTWSSWTHLVNTTFRIWLFSKSCIQIVSLFHSWALIWRRFACLVVILSLFVFYHRIYLIMHSVTFRLIKNPLSGGHIMYNINISLFDSMYLIVWRKYQLIYSSKMETGCF